MSANQLIGLVLILAGLGDLLAIAFLRRRLPPPQARTISIVLAGFALAMIGIGIAILVQRPAL
jgi:hypothetical protein